MSTWRSGAETASHVGRMAAVSMRLHQILGTASMASEHPTATVMFDELSLEHAWHASLLTERLPRRAGVNRADLLVLGPIGPAMEVMAELASGGDTVGVASAYRSVMLPRLIESGGDIAASCSQAAERSLLRSLAFIGLDLEAATKRSGALVESLTGDRGSAAHAERVARDLEEVLLEVLGTRGLGV